MPERNNENTLLKLYVKLEKHNFIYDFERFNPYILNHIIINFERYCDEGRLKWKERYETLNPYNIIKSYLNDSDNGLLKICYKQKNNIGRYDALGNISLQKMPRIIRNTISREYYTDIDMVNCFAYILKFICECNKIKCDNLSYYIENREDCLKEISDDRDYAKEIFIKSSNGGGYDKKQVKNSTFIEKYNKEMLRIHKKLFEIYKTNTDLYNLVLEDRKKKDKNYNIEATLTGYIIRDIENKLLREIVNYYKNQYIIEYCVLCSDGCMLPKEYNYNLLDCEKHIYNKFGIEIKLKIKEMNNYLDLSLERINYNYDDLLIADNTKKIEEGKKCINEGCEIIHLATYFYEIYGKNYKLLNGKIYSFNGNYWYRNVNNEELYKAVRNKIFIDLKKILEKNTNIENSKNIGELYKKLSKLQQPKSINDIITDINKHIILNDDIFDNNKNLIGFTNGVYDLELMVFRKGRYDDYVSITTGYDYKHCISTTNAYNYLRKVFVNIDEYNYIMLLFSTILCGYNIRKIGILTGIGRNSKSILLDILSYMMGNYSYKANTDILMNKIKIGACPELANLNKIRLVYFNEPPKKACIIGATLKDLVSGEDVNGISARGLYSNDTDTILHSTNFILCNKKPEIDEVNDAIYSRIVVCPFKSIFMEKSQMEDYKNHPNLFLADNYVRTEEFRDIMKVELFQILINFYKKFKENGYELPEPPEEYKNATAIYLDEANDFNSWFNTQYEKTDNDNDYIQLKNIFQDFNNSEYYRNLEKKEKRKMNKTKLLNEMLQDPKYRSCYKARHTYIKNNKRFDILNCFMNYKRIIEENSIISDED